MTKTQPIQITDAARAHLLTLLASESAQGFALSVKAAGCSGYRYVPEMAKAAPADALQFMVGDLMVWVPKASLRWLEGTTVDLKRESLGQTQLVFRNPRAQDVCGCGESFNLKEATDENTSA